MSKFDFYQLQFQTSVACEDLDRREKALDNASHDWEKVERLRQRKCQACYYVWGSGIVLQGRTGWECHGCGSAKMASTSDTFKLCDDCSDKYGACRKCGADINLNENRKKLERKKK